MEEPTARALERASSVLKRFDLDPSRTALSVASISENIVLRASLDGVGVASLRLVRPGSRSRGALLSELAWITALRHEGLPVLEPLLPATARSPEDAVVELGEGWFVVAFHWIVGSTLPEALETNTQRSLGALAARLHAQARRWRPPPWWTRWRWTPSTLVGPEAHWGSLDAVTEPELRRLLASAARHAGARLGRLALSELPIHSDLRPANVVRTASGELTVIDFDDAGWGTTMLDLAGSVSFHEHEPNIVEAVVAWLEGYESVRPLTPAERAAVWPSIMLRRLALLAWATSRRGSLVARSLAPSLRDTTGAVAEAFLAGALDDATVSTAAEVPA